MRGRLARVLAVALALMPALLVPVARPARAADAARPVMAFYYPWYELSDWTSGRTADVASPTYSGGDDATLLRHIQEADDAGIDALICTWYGPTEERLDHRCRRLLQLVQQSGRHLRVAIIPDQSAAFDPAMRTVDGLAAALAVLRRDFMSSPASFTFRGKPAVFWFNPPSLGGVAAWQQLRAQADPNHDEYWFGGTDDFSYLDAYDALYYYDITWESAPGAAMASYAARLAGYNAAHGEQRPFIGTVMPGYDDLRIRPDGHRRDREGGAYYQSTWQNAIDHQADAVVLTSFNEFFEGTYVEPSAAYGDLYLRLTKEGAARYHALAPPASPPAAGCRAFPETGHQVCGRFLAYWQAHGGLAINGYPLSGEVTATLEDGKPYTVQYFERVRMEYHLENADPRYQVVLGQFGRRILAGVPDAPTAPTSAKDGSTFFQTTGHNVNGRFMAYWNAHGGLAQFGYPLSEAFQQQLEDGKTYTVQYFERARFEYHPENPPPYDVELGQFGRRIYAEVRR
ncbi:MAG TPA: hypothetical protein VFL91_14940 [Thermomicrobiales bacterium]|nr:hypothetical protein [Thermomicrobiales bacterium]